jgi:DNA-binding NarL/FixJ family response regulator
MTVTLVPQPTGGGFGAPGLEHLRVLVGDGDSRFAGALADLLRCKRVFDVVDVVTSAREMVESAEHLVPDVALIGEFPDADVGELTRCIGRTSGAAVILLVRPTSGVPAQVHAHAFLRREGTVEEILDGFLEVAAFAAALQNSRRRSAV